MTCEGCIHCDVCVKKEEAVQVDERNWANYELLDAVENYCKDFKNKADFVEVVRCGKCKHGEKYVIDNDTFLYKCYRMGIGGFVEDFHCGYGERRDANV